MSGRIPESFIHELVARTDIVDVIDAQVPLRKAGGEFVACCPFHNEKTPSFTVSPQKQFYHCFGCGAHGSAIGFLMEYEHLGFVEAVEVLARRAGLEIPQTEGRQVSAPLEPLYALLDRAAQYYRHQLRAKGADAAVDYLKGRGLSGEAARDFGLGYAPEGWHNLHAALGGDADCSRLLVEAGLLTEKDTGEPYDRFRGRIMFPIRDRRGRVVGFGGRILGAGKPKYLNSPETAVFHKGHELYGLFEARAALRHIERLLVVEGYMDVVALAQFGVRNVVATLGTATTQEQLDALLRVAQEVVFCFDGDRAGRDAAWKALKNALPATGSGRQLRFLFLPEGEDPDSLVRKEGRASFEARLGGAAPLSELFFERLSQDLDKASMDGRAALVERARPLLERIPAGVFRHLMVGRLAAMVTMDVARLEQAMGFKGARAEPAMRRNPRRQGLSAVARTIAMLVQNPRLAPMASVLTGSDDGGIPGMALLQSLLDLLGARPNLTTGAIIEHWRDSKHGQNLQKLAVRPLYVPEDGLEAEFVGLVERVERIFVEQRTDRLLARADELSRGEKEELSHLLSRLKVKAISPND
jgi:DNA primase